MESILGLLKSLKIRALVFLSHFDTGKPFFIALLRDYEKIWIPSLTNSASSLHHPPRCREHSPLVARWYADCSKGSFLECSPLPVEAQPVHVSPGQSWDLWFRMKMAKMPWSSIFIPAYIALKGPKHEIFESGFFTQIRRLWLGDLETGEKKWTFESWSHYFKVFAANFFY